MSKSSSPPSDPPRDPPLDVRVVEAIADAKGTDPTDVPQLYGDLDLEALEALVGNSTAEIHVRVPVQGYTVEIHGDEVHVE